jgi:CTP synthase
LHPFFVATQAHPELRSRPTKPHPLFSGLIAAALVRQRESRLPVEDLASAKKASGSAAKPKAEAARAR